MEGAFRESLHVKAKALLKEIYGEECDEWSYYNSWKLRGDDPELYRKRNLTIYDENSKAEQFSPRLYYEFYRAGKYGEIKEARRINLARELYCRYHYDPKVRSVGNRSESYEIEEEYVHVSSELQRCMRAHLSDAGIIAECNPSSNLLIGPFQQYKEHPMWKMDHGNLFSEKHDARMDVTINTDDIGVFATSLENEYALMLQSGCRMRREEYGLKDDQAVYDYLENIRQNGHRAIFTNPKDNGPV